MNFRCLLPLLLLAGCASQPNHQGVNWGEGACPKPDPKDISATNHLIIQDGKTLKCQIRPYVWNMACQGIVDGNTDGVVCQDKGGNQMIFLFDEKGVLTTHRSLRAG
jgi:hypothetical protein